MAAYALRRILLMIPVLIGVSLIVFLSVRLLPGDAAQVLLGAESSEAQLARTREELGLQRPWPVQYAQWMACMARGDLGRSLRTQFRVTELIGQKVPATVELALAALLVAAAVGAPLGFLAGYWRDSWFDRATSALFTAGISMPGFAIGTLLILLFTVQRQWLPSSGFIAFGEDPRKNLEYLLLPALALSANAVSSAGRMARAAMVDTGDQPYVRFAIAKGLPNRVVLWRHRMTNAAAPVVSLLSLQAGYLLAGAVLIETLFGWPGVGKLLAASIFERDYPVVQALVVIDCAVFLISNLAGELAVAWIDPRVRA